MTSNPSWQRSPALAGETPTGTQDPQPGATPVSTNGETPGEGTTEGLSELESLKVALKKANAEAASHRHKAKELDDLKAQIEAEKLSEKEKLEKRLSDLQGQYDIALRERQERIIAYEVQLQASQMGIVDPSAAARLLDWSGLEYDDTGQPQNVEKLLKDLVKAKPWLAGKPGNHLPGGGATNPARSQTTGHKELSWEAIGQMKADEYEARRAEIQAFMMNSPPRFGQRLR